MKNNILLILVSVFLSLVFSCRNNQVLQGPGELTPLISVKTTAVYKGDIQNHLDLNGKTVILEKNTVLTPISGYIVKINAHYGDRVDKNELLFEIQTRENKALEGISDSLAPGGIIKVLASSSGIINELQVNQTGLFVNEGNPLCTITESERLLVQVNVPYEYSSLVKSDTRCKITLPGKSVIDARVFKILPIIDENSQTQNVLLRLSNNKNIPENLNVTVQFLNSKKNQVLLIKKDAVLANETQNEFWVMKMLNDSLAVKKLIKKGVENDSIIEVISDELAPGDKVIIEGGYGLPDSALVKYTL